LLDRVLFPINSTDDDLPLQVVALKIYNFEQ
jgi:hypothetical protein